jgi:hypothetical protein
MRLARIGATFTRKGSDARVGGFAFGDVSEPAPHSPRLAVHTALSMTVIDVTRRGDRCQFSSFR